MVIPRTVVGLAKNASLPIEVGNGMFETTVVLTVTNLGNVGLSDVRVTDDLRTTFPTPASFSVVSAPVATGTLTVNPDFDGDSVTELLHPSSLAAGATETISFTLQFLPDDLPARYQNTATASGRSSDGTVVTDVSDHGSDPDANGNGNPNEAGENDPTPIEVIPEIDLVKTGTLDLGGDGVAHPGDVIHYSFQVSNSGNVGLSNVHLNDPTVPQIDCPSGAMFSLPAGAAETCSGSYAITLADIDAGTKHNVATATADDPHGNPVSDEASHSEPIQSTAAIDVAKQVSPPLDVGGGAFETTVTLTVTNPGNVGLSEVRVQDDLSTAFPLPATFQLQGSPTATGSFSVNPGYDGLTDVELLIPQTSTLPIAATETINFTVRFVPDDLPACFENIATATGTDADGSVVSDGDQAPIEVLPALDLTIQPGKDVFTTVTGSYADFAVDPIPMDFFEEGSDPFNSRVDFTGVPLDPSVYGDADSIVERQEPAILTGCPASATIAIELLALNLASTDPITVTYEGGGSPELWDVSVGVSTIPSTGSMTIHSECLSGGTFDSQLTVHPHYFFTRRRDGLMRDLDPGPDKIFEVTGSHWLRSLGSGVELPDSSSFFPGFEAVPCTCAARCSDKQPTDPILHVASGGAHRVAPTTTVIGLAKQASVPEEVGGGAFETTLNLTVANLGNVDLSQVQVIDVLSTTFPSGSFMVVGLPSASGTLTANPNYNGNSDVQLLMAPSLLPAGTTATITFVVRFLPAEIPASFFNSATASGLGTDGSMVEDPSDDGTVPDADGDGNPNEEGENDPTPIQVVPALNLLKSGILDDGGDGVAHAGDKIHYTLQVSNVGNVTLTAVGISDPDLLVLCPGGNPIPSLAVESSATCTATYTLTQDDIDASRHDNTATADSDQTDPVEADASVLLAAVSSLNLDKRGVLDLGSDGVAGPGDLIDYTFEVNNTGNRALMNLGIDDPLVAQILCPGGSPIPLLAPQTTVTCDATYTVTQNDVDAQVVVNTATATGLDSDGNTVNGQDIENVAVPPDEPAPIPFVCTGEAYMIQGTDAQLGLLERSGSPFAFLPVSGPLGSEINSLGFRSTDGLFYGVELVAGGNLQVVKIDATGTVFGIGRPEGLPPAVRFDAGDVSSDGDTMFLAASNHPLYTIDLTSETLVAEPVPVTGDTGFVFDWAYNPADGRLYGGDMTHGQLAVLDPVTGIRTDFAVEELPSGTPFGGAWFDGSGHLFLYQNDGLILEIDSAAPTIVNTQTGPGASRNDGAACVQNLVGAAKEMTATRDGLPERVTIRYEFENFGTESDLFDLAATEDLTAVFGVHGMDWTFLSISSDPIGFANPTFDGHSDLRLINAGQSLLAQETAGATVELEVSTLEHVNPNGSFCNQITIVGRTLDGLWVGDLSTRGLDSDPDDDGNPSERRQACLNLGQAVFTCVNEGLIIQNVNAQLTLVDLETSPFTFVPIGPPTGLEINNLGFRRTDGLLYGIQLTPQGNEQLVQLDATGAVFGLGRPPGLPADIRLDAGDVSTDGTTLFLTATNKRLYSVPLPDLAPVTSIKVTGSKGLVFDWAYNPQDRMLYGGDRTDGQLAILDPLTGVRTDRALPGLPRGINFGGAWFDASGRLMLYGNDGTLFEIDWTLPAIVATYDGPGSSRNDGAACVPNPDLLP